MISRIFSTVIVVLILAGCSAAPPEQLAPSPLPTATPTPAPTAVIDVPVQGTSPVVPETTVAPTRVQIPSVGIDIPVEPVGVQSDGLMEIPTNISVAGWYRFGPGPASAAGSTVITAHVDSFEQGLGPFAYLKEMPMGAEVIVTTADGADHRYLVESVQNVAKEQLPLDQVFDRAGAPRLVLITCGGQFDQNVLNYSDNLIAIAAPA